MRQSPPIRNLEWTALECIGIGTNLGQMSHAQLSSGQMLPTQMLFLLMYSIKIIKESYFFCWDKIGSNRI